MNHPDLSESLAEPGVDRSNRKVVNPNQANIQVFQSELFHRSNISLNDSGVGISPLTPRTTVFTFDTIEDENIYESINPVEIEINNDDYDDPELSKIVNSFASISSNPSESERIRPNAPMNCLKTSDKTTDKNDNDDDDDDNNDDNGDDNNGDDENNNDIDNKNDNNDDYEDDENDDVFLNDLETINVDEEQQRINNYLLARINRVEHHLSLQYHRRNNSDRTSSTAGSGRSNIFRARLGGLQIRCQRFVKRILGMAMPSNDSAGIPFGIERQFIERMTVNVANNEENPDACFQSSCPTDTSSIAQVQRSAHLPDVVPDSAVMAREIMRNMARKERLQRNACYRSASFAASSSSTSAERQSIENRRTMSVSFPIEVTRLTAVARQLREISIDFSAQNQMRPFSSFSSLYPVFDLLTNTLIETTRRVSRVTRRRTFAASSGNTENLTNNSDIKLKNSQINFQNKQFSKLSNSSQNSTTTPVNRPPTPHLTSSASLITSRGRVVNNSRFYTSFITTENDDSSSSQFIAKCHEENNNEY